MSNPIMGIIERVIKADEMPTDTPHGWIQWKGTRVCMDVHCTCGFHGHIDEDFAYYYICPACTQVYAVGQTVKLHQLTDEEAALITEGGLCLVTSDMEDDQ